MASEISFGYLPGAVLYGIARNATGEYLTPAGGLEPFNPADWPSYALGLGELAPPSGQYAGNFPPAPAGAYSLEVYLQRGASPATTDGPPIGAGAMQWDGAAEVALAAILQVPALFGTVEANPAPAAGFFNVLLAEALDPRALPAAFQGLSLTSMPGGANGAPVYRAIAGVTIVNPVTLTVSLLTALPVAPAAGDLVSISG